MVADLIRLVVVPVFAWAAWRDLRTRRVPNWLWPPLIAFGVVLLIWDVTQLFVLGEPGGQQFLFQTAVSILVVGPLGYCLWWLGGFGAADAKAIITLSVLLPTVPSYTVSGMAVPAVESTIGVFSLTVLTNAVLFVGLTPIWLGATNLVRGHRQSATLFVARPVSIDTLDDRHGRLVGRVDGTNRQSLDLDVLQSYMQWRGISLQAIETVPDTSDPWCVEAFFETTDEPTYGVTPDDLREGVKLVAEIDGERVLASPGVPFFVPLFVGMIVALTYGNLLFGLLPI